VNFVQKALQIWKQDNLLRRVVRNSGYLIVGNALSTMVQSILSGRLLGILGFGILGAAIEFATNINRLFSFRMGEIVVKYMGQFLAEDQRDRAAAVFKAAVLLETISSILAYLLIVLLAPLAATVILRDVALAPLISFYALAMLANFALESSTGFLQTVDRFRSQAIIGFIQSLLTAGIILYAYLTHGTIWLVMGAYLTGKAFNGLGLAAYAFWRARQVLGAGWWRASFRLLPPPREFWTFAWSTNFSGTVTMVTRDSESVWISALAGPLAAGYYKTAKAVINLVTLPITPFITAAYPAINRSIAERAWARLRRLLRRLTVLSAAWTGAAALGLIVLGRWLITTFYGADFAPAYPAILLLLLGYGFANIFYWNRNLLLSFGQPDYPLKVTAFAGAAKLMLTLLLVPRFGYLMEAGLLSAFFIVSIGLIVWKGWKEIGKHPDRDELPSAAPTESAAPLPPSAAPTESAAPFAPSAADRQPVRRAPRRFSRWDALALLTFLAFSLLYFLGKLQDNYPLVLLTGDAGNIASYAAALDHPDWFAADPVLGDPSNIGIYATLHIPLLRLLAPLAGNYALAYAWLVLPQTFLQLTGFYLLGRVLFRSRFWAYLLAWLTSMTVTRIGLGEIWGVWQDALPRVTFQSLLPFLLTLALLWKDAPRRWPWLMFLAGLLVYAHPISAPAWGLALWLGLWTRVPRAWTWPRRLLVMFALGLVFLLALAPFAWNYISYRSSDSAADYETVMTVLQTYWPENLLNVPAAVGAFLSQAVRSLLLPLAVGGGVALGWIERGGKGEREKEKGEKGGAESLTDSQANRQAKSLTYSRTESRTDKQADSKFNSQVKSLTYSRTDSQADLPVVIAWMVGLFLASVALPFAERLIEARFHLLPFETELLRGIRYFVPLLLLFWLWPLAVLSARPLAPRLRLGLMGLGILLVAFWGTTNRPAIGDMLDAALCLGHGRMVCAAPRPLDELLTGLQVQTRPGESVLFFNQEPAHTSQTIAVRYLALRPLVYTPRDVGLLGYGHRAALEQWLTTTRQVEALRAEADEAARLAGIVQLAQSLDADYLALDFAPASDLLSGLSVRVLVQNEAYTLLQLP
jgi:O-antigen/teichoic acid export membrane protein